jgi:hypothetical protein
MIKKSQPGSDYYARLERYRDHLADRITAELKKYHFKWKDIVAAYALSADEKQELEKHWKAYYRESAWFVKTHPALSPEEVFETLFLQRPFLPAPTEYQDYLEYLRICKILVEAAEKYNAKMGNKL